MLRILFLFALVFVGYYFRLDSGSETTIGSLINLGYTIVIPVILFSFVDFVVLKNVVYYKLLTFFLTSTMLFVTFFCITAVSGVGLNIHMNPNVESIVVLDSIILIFFFSLRVGATALYFKKKNVEAPDGTLPFIVDTSAIIDGRILELCENGFISSSLIIPEFVIRELQLISDSSNHEKRKKGRRGLDLLKKMKNSDLLSITITPIDYDFLKGVDNKLLHYAKENKARLITTDYNLIKVAEVEEIIVLNINKIATILKPAYTVGEKLKVNIAKKGNSKKQGIGYLEDDTMVVIEDGEKYIGQPKTVLVTSFVQSHSGKMLFCKLT